MYWFNAQMLGIAMLSTNLCNGQLGYTRTN